MSGKISIYERGTGKQYSIKVAANQKVVQIHRVQNYINFEANFKAMATLSSNAYVLYMYILMHDNRRIWALSSKDVYAKTALTEKTYTKAVAELIENRYLVKGDIQLDAYTTYSENAYHLYELPELCSPPNGGSK